MKTIQRTLGLILLLSYLSGCSQLTGVTNVPTQTSPATRLVQTESPVRQATASPSSTTYPAATVTNSITPQPSEAATAQGASITLAACQLVQVTQPPFPVATLSPNGLDPETDLHVTGRAQQIDLATYRLKVSGLVDHPLSLTYDELRCLPKVTDNPLLNCPGVFKDEATWSGVPIKYILDLAGVQQGATDLVLVSADGYQVKLPLATASLEKNFLAYELNGNTLPVLHGFPLRAVFPGMWGSYWLKWLVEIQID
jgi:DMSO/TMAO reductase YedYZ molybdopterin-dependent catalytic subunit